MEIIPREISVNDVILRNDNNYHHLSPFRFEFIDLENDQKITKLIIDAKFYETKIVNSELDKVLHQIFPVEIKNDILFGKDNYPEFVWDAYFKVYNIVFEWYSAEYWYQDIILNV